MNFGKWMLSIFASVALAACGSGTAKKTNSNSPSTPSTDTSGASGSDSSGSSSNSNELSKPSFAIAGQNYYDVNMDGILGVQDTTVPSPWPVQVTPLNQDGTPTADPPIVLCTDPTTPSPIGGAYSYKWPSPPSYPKFTVTEVQATNSTQLPDGTTFPTWVQTGSTSIAFSVDPTSGASVTLTNNIYDVTAYDTNVGFNITGLNFGNLCLGSGGAPVASGGGALGFWANSSGEAKIATDDTVMSSLTSLNLVNQDGSAFDPSSYSLSGWLSGATATNMAYKLSVHLASMWLNVYFNFVSGAAFLYAPDTKSANQFGIATVDDLMAEANTELGLHPDTTASGTDSAYRGYQQALKNALDGGNNNKGFVQMDLQQCPAPTFAQPCP